MRKSAGVLKCVRMGAVKNRSSVTHIPAHSHTRTLPIRGFTLLEVMIAIVILAIAMTVVGQLFSTVTRSWTGARIVMDKMHHGDFVLGQLTASLRSMVMLTNSQEQCGFRIENNPAGDGEHTISWVTASSAFIPPGEDAYAHGLHRIEVGGGSDKDGVDGLVVTVWPYLADEEKVEKKSWLVSENITGLRCKIYDMHDGKENWTDKWEYSNAIPGLVEITLYAKPSKEDAEPVMFRQIIEIPLGPAVTNDVSEAK